jgi:exportin-2 (importin alpha re-exporter)
VLVTYLSSAEFVVYTYAAVTLERILLLKRDNIPVFTKTDLAPLLGDLLGALFTLIEKDPQPEKLAENDFLMRCKHPKTPIPVQTQLLLSCYG